MADLLYPDKTREELEQALNCAQIALWWAANEKVGPGAAANAQMVAWVAESKDAAVGATITRRRMNAERVGIPC